MQFRQQRAAVFTSSDPTWACAVQPSMFHPWSRRFETTGAYRLVTAAEVHAVQSSGVAATASKPPGADGRRDDWADL